MRSEELAQEVEDTVQRLRDRVVGVGEEQYSSGDRQKFEDIDLRTLFEMTLEELDDTIVYAVMLQIRFKRLIAILDERSV